MAHPRFYCSEPIAASQTLELNGPLAHHVRVRRLEAGARVTLFDGRGGEFEGVLQFQDKKTLVTLGQHLPCETELSGEITLVQALPAGDKMDWIIEKAVELGVKRIVPISAQRSVLKLTGQRLDKRLEHWRAIVVAASEQSGRNQLLQLCAPVTLEQALLSAPTGLRLLCDPEASESLAERLSALEQVSDAERKLSLLVGPEGGWSPGEIASARAQHVKQVQFGLRVLRTETAGLALVAAATALLRW